MLIANSIFRRKYIYFWGFALCCFKLILKWFDYNLDKHILMALILVPMVSTVMVRSLKFLVPFSVIATNLIFLGVMLTMAISMQDMPPVSSRFAVASWSQLPLFFGTAIYCFEGIGLVRYYFIWFDKITAFVIVHRK